MNKIKHCSDDKNCSLRHKRYNCHIYACVYECTYLLCMDFELELRSFPIYSSCLCRSTVLSSVCSRICMYVCICICIVDSLVLVCIFILKYYADLRLSRQGTNPRNRWKRHSCVLKLIFTYS